MSAFLSVGFCCKSLVLLLIWTEAYNEDSLRVNHESDFNLALAAIRKLRGRSIHVHYDAGGSTRLTDRDLGKPDPFVLHYAAMDNSNASTFSDWVSSHNWKFSPHKHRQNWEAIPIIEQRLLPFLIMEPVVEADSNAQPPPLVQIPDGCSEHQDVFAGARPAPVAMIDMFMFGYEADTLEVRLHEYADIVDMFVILEPEVSFWGVPRSVMWDYLRTQTRFKPFLKKVLHIVFTADHFGADKSNATWFPFTQENTVGNLTKKMLPDMLYALGLTKESVVINFGDTDEVTSRNNMHLMKHCQPKRMPVDSAIWYAPGRADYAYQSDFPVAGMPWSFGDPTFQLANNFSGHGRGRSGPYLLGGMHMTGYTYLPFWIMKAISTSDSRGIPDFAEKLLSVGLLKDLSKSLHDMRAISESAHERHHTYNVVLLEDLYKLSPKYKEMVHWPWFLKANADRYPTWWGRDDPRNYAKVKREHRMPADSPVAATDQSLQVDFDGALKERKSMKSSRLLRSGWMDRAHT
mmetsp:Transcript_108144/g.207843  ORF Transcript_108144/g.207843 Transcript_108144/m.207843 type:complete len:518 (+) Transcript_108144:20-1573(+)